MLKKFFLFSIFIISISPVFAKDSSSQKIPEISFTFPDVIVSAPAWKKPVYLTGKPDIKVSAQENRFSNYQILSQILDKIPGLAIRTSGGPGHIASPNLGGLTGNKVLVVKDGIPINDPFTGSPDISNICPDSIDQIEIWKGNQSAKWGGNSIGGVINLTSREPQKGKLKFSTDGIGGFGYQIQTGISFGNSRFRIRKGHFYTPGWSAASEESGNTERDSFEQDEFQLSFNHETTQGEQLTVNYLWNKSLTELDGFNPVTQLPIDSLSFRQIKLSSDFNFGYTSPVHNGEWRFTHAFAHGSLTGIDKANIFNEYGLEFSRQIQTVSRSIEHGKNKAALEFYRQEIFAENFNNYANREVSNAFTTQISRNISKSLSLSTSVRHEDSNNSSGVTTGNASLAYTKKNFSFKSEVGNGFRMPSMNERFYPNFGDPDLNEEFSSSAMVKVGYKFPKLFKLSASINTYKIRDMIGTVATADPKYTWGIKSANIGETKLRSHKISLDDLTIKGLKLNAYVEILDKAKIKNSTAMPPGVLARQAGLNISKQLNTFKIDLSSKWWGNSWETTTNNRSNPPGHQLDLHLSKKLNQIQANVSFINLTNNNKERVFGYTRAGRHVKFSLESSF
jgi:vitamin B12 transporter